MTGSRGIRKVILEIAVRDWLFILVFVLHRVSLSIGKERECGPLNRRVKVCKSGERDFN